MPANYVPVYYAGGRNIEQFRGTGEPATSPEDWVGSLCALPRALLPAHARPETGVSPTEYGSMLELVAADPEGWLGRRLAAAYGGQSGLLVKLLDAGERLPVHCHPTREFARAHLGSLFGKTEGWFVMHAEPEACVWIGMREAVDEAIMRRWIITADVSAMLAAMNQVPVRAGQVVYVPAGLPHAIGPGVMVIELQEPTSFSVLADHAAFGVDSQAATLGLGWELAVSCFDLTAHGSRLDRLLPSPSPRPLPGAQLAREGRLLDLFPAEAAEFFRAWRADCAGELVLSDLGFAILVVIDGHGWLEWDGGGHRAVRRGETLAVPAAVEALRLVGDVSVIACLPPTV